MTFLKIKSNDSRKAFTICFKNHSVAFKWEKQKDLSDSMLIAECTIKKHDKMKIISYFFQKTHNNGRCKLVYFKRKQLLEKQPHG